MPSPPLTPFAQAAEYMLVYLNNWNNLFAPDPIESK